MRNIDFEIARSMLYWCVDWKVNCVLRDIKQTTNKSLEKIDDM